MYTVECFVAACNLPKHGVTSGGFYIKKNGGKRVVSYFSADNLKLFYV